MKELVFLQEVWKDIPGYEGMYQASSLGRIKSLERDACYRKDKNRTYHKDEKILISHYDKKGYLRVKIYNGEAKGYTTGVHRLVALAFIPNYHNLSMVNHINGIKDDNRPGNLMALPRNEHDRIAEPYKKRIRELEAEIFRLKQLNLFNS